jgi:hypothetical protein
MRKPDLRNALVRVGTKTIGPDTVNLLDLPSRTYATQRPVGLVATDALRTTLTLGDHAVIVDADR